MGFNLDENISMFMFRIRSQVLEQVLFVAQDLEVLGNSWRLVRTISIYLGTSSTLWSQVTTENSGEDVSFIVYGMFSTDVYEHVRNSCVVYRFVWVTLALVTLSNPLQNPPPKTSQT